MKNHRPLRSLTLATLTLAAALLAAPAANAQFAPGGIISVDFNSTNSAGATTTLANAGPNAVVPPSQ